MQVQPTNTASQVAPAAVTTGVPARVVAGDLATVPIGSLLNATVTSVTQRDAVLTVNGQTLTIRTPADVQLQPGTVLLARVPPNSANATNPTLELNISQSGVQGRQTAAATPQTLTSTTTALPNTVSRSTAPVITPAQTSTPRATPTAAPSTAPPLAAVDVLSTLPNGGVLVRINGEEQTATTTEPLAAGGRYVLEVSQTPNGIALKSPPDTPKLQTDIATAILRTPTSTLASALKPLQAELAALVGQPTSTTAASTAQPTTTQPATTPAASTTQQPNGEELPASQTLLGALATAAQSLSATPSNTTQSANTAQLTNAVQPTATGQKASTPTPPAVQKAANAVLTTLRTFIPTDSRPPNATELQNLIENGGLHYEAKLARLVEAPATTTSSPNPAATNSSAQATKGTASEPTTTTNNSNTTTTQAAQSSTAPTTTAISPDLKGDLMRLLQTVQELGGAVQAPAAQAALSGLEAQQATNALAQQNGAPYYLQIPFPDNGVWRTLNLSLEPQNQSSQQDSGQASRFRMFMHVPLTDLGETWIDAGLSGDKLRATIYLTQPTVQARVQAALPDLQTELQSDGFSEVLLNVRSASELPARYRQEGNAMQAGRPATVSVLDVRA